MLTWGRSVYPARFLHVLFFSLSRCHWPCNPRLDSGAFLARLLVAAVLGFQSPHLFVLAVHVWTLEQVLNMFLCISVHLGMCCLQFVHRNSLIELSVYCNINTGSILRFLVCIIKWLFVSDAERAFVNKVVSILFTRNFNDLLVRTVAPKGTTLWPINAMHSFAGQG